MGNRTEGPGCRKIDSVASMLPVNGEHWGHKESQPRTKLTERDQGQQVFRIMGFLTDDLQPSEEQNSLRERVPRPCKRPSGQQPSLKKKQANV